MNAIVETAIACTHKTPRLPTITQRQDIVPTPEGEADGYEQEQHTYNESLRRCELSDLTAREDRRVEVTVA